MNGRLGIIIYDLTPSRVYRVLISFIFAVVQRLLVFVVLLLRCRRFGGVWTDAWRFKLRGLVRVDHLLVLVVDDAVLTLVDHSVDVLGVLLDLLVVTHVFLVVSAWHSIYCRREFDRLRGLMGQTGRI